MRRASAREREWTMEILALVLTTIGLNLAGLAVALRSCLSC